MTYLLITRADGGLSVLQLLGEADPQTELEKWAAQADAAWLPIASARTATDPAFPDRAFRAGWADDGATVVVNQSRLDAAAAALYAAVKQRAKQLFQLAEQSAQRDRSIVLVALDEVNALRDWITQFKAAVAGAGTLAALKTSVAALPNLPQRTAAQAKAAVLARIDTADADAPAV